jgi:ADP-heptose:LPS heptosyltransferase
MSLKETALRLSARALLSVEGAFRSGPTASPSSVLILEYMLPLGCCVHLTPVYEAIKRAHPATTITVATRGLGRSLLRHHPLVDHLIDTPDPFVSSVAAVKALRSELKRRSLQPHCILTGASDRRSRVALMAMLSSSAWRGGFTLHPELYQRPLAYDPDRSLIDNNLRLASLVGGAAAHLEPRVFFSAADAAVATALVAEASPNGRPLVLFVTQNSGKQSTGWHAGRFVEVIRHANEVLGCAVAYVGTVADREPIERIRELAGGIGVSVAGRTSVTQLAALLALSDVVVSLDTGTMHVGRAVGVPMVVIGPSWQKPLEWLPLGVPQVRILRGPDRDGVPPGYQLDEVQVHDVIGALDDLLTAYPPSAESRQHRLQTNTSTVDHAVES